tara:strand:- start:3 stop:431 length:429 start_codon:yes stop_codon:yes gene_type:complete
MLGQCLCENISFEIKVATADLYQCHCSLCRKSTGSASNTALIVEAANFIWLSGRENISSFTKTSGFRSDFCSTCGSPVPNPLRNTGFYWIPAGLLEGNTDIQVVAHLHTASKAPWDILQKGHQYATMPEIDELIHLLRNSHG